jgi:exodeoxyribonuclease-5
VSRRARSNRPTKPRFPLNDDQALAYNDVAPSIEARRQHLVTGNAGSGKTYFARRLLYDLARGRKRIVGAAPTHKAVAVLSRAMRQHGIDIPFRTIQSVLGVKPAHDGERMRFTRDRNAAPVDADVVLIDEGSMLSAELMDLIDKHLVGRAVVFLADPAQLPPVNERESRVFEVARKFHLSVPVRQAADNPIYGACQAIRRAQDGAMDWSWTKAARKDGKGIYVPSDDDAWLARAFRSQEYADDPDAFRLVTWTNRSVATWNNRIRVWIHGVLPDLPFVAGERLLVRAPVFEGGDAIMQTNEEVDVVAIEPGVNAVRFDALGDLDGWDAEIGSWVMRVRTAAGAEHIVYLCADESEYDRTAARLTAEAAENRKRWRDFHEFRQSFIKGQHAHCLTVHNAQGSTFKHVFCNMREMTSWVRADHWEGTRGLYVAASRPTGSLILIGM